MQGYYKDELATAETLHDGWLLTGDLATVDEEGFIFLSARKKEIIKVGGRRISPKEIEEVIVSMPEVVDCTIQGITDEILGESMKATVILNGSQSIEGITEETIRAFCAERLAPYKIPQIIEIRDKISLTATGKKVKGQAS
jgi:acyl-CoA synthetase (AMP-forming)/AMP-acid ligase II